MSVTEEKKTQTDILTELIAVSGELPADSLNRFDSVKYHEKLITGLKSDGMIRTHYKDKVRGYRVTAKAKKILLARNPSRFSFYVTGDIGTNRVKSEVTRRLRLHRISEAAITMYNAGVKIFRDEKPRIFYPAAENTANPQTLAVKSPSFYSSLEFKEIGGDLIKIQNARAVGVLLAAEDIFVVYNTENAMMKWEYKSEIKTKALMRHYLCYERMPHQYGKHRDNIKGLILGNTMDILYTLLTGTGGYRKSYFYLDDTFHTFIFLTNDRHGEKLLKLLCDPTTQNKLNAALLEDMSPPDRSLPTENDGIDSNGNPVLFSYLPDMPRLSRFVASLNQWERTGTVICFDFQEEVFASYCGERVSFETIVFEKFEKVFFPIGT